MGKNEKLRDCPAVGRRIKAMLKRYQKIRRVKPIFRAKIRTALPRFRPRNSSFSEGSAR